MVDPRALGHENGINSAILRYDGAQEVEPTQLDVPSTNPLYEWNLRALTDPAVVRICNIDMSMSHQG